MATLNISLPDPMKEFVEAQASKEGFETVSEYVRSVLGEIQKRQAKRDLETKLLEGLQGPFVEITAEDWDSIEQEAKDRFDREQSSP